MTGRGFTEDNIIMLKPQVVFIVSLLFSFVSLGQTQDRLTSVIDSDLTIKNMAVAPLVDNVNGLYVKSLSAELLKIVEADPQRQGISVQNEGRSSVVEILSRSKADSLLSTQLEKGSRGITLRMKLFSGSQGKLFAEEERRDLQEFSVAELSKKLSEMYAKIITKIPYEGIVMSRSGTRVTVDLGSKQGVSPGQNLTAFLIVKEQRHPAFQFLVSTEREIVGRITLTQVEENLSFGEVVLERLPNQVNSNTKLLVTDQMTVITTNENGTKTLGDRIESDAIFGSKPKEWYERDPSIGLMELMVGFTQADISNQVNTIGGVASQKSLVPTGSLKGELWLTADYLLSLKLGQRLGSVSNSYPGSTPSSLNFSVQSLEFDGGYQLPLVPGDYLGDRLKFLVGYVSKSVKIDESSPTAYTSATFTGFRIGAEYDMPSIADSNYGLQFGFKYVLIPRVSETPVSSGSDSKAQIGELGIKGSYSFRKNLKWKAEILWEQNSASFTGDGTRTPDASSLSYNFWHFGAGIEYLF